jgi:hypothetical protein
MDAPVEPDVNVVTVEKRVLKIVELEMVSVLPESQVDPVPFETDQFVEEAVSAMAVVFVFD